MFSFFEKFKSTDDDEDDDNLYLLYILIPIFSIIFFGFIGYWMSKKSFQPRVLIHGQNISSFNAPKGRKKITEYFTEYFKKSKNTPQHYKSYFNAQSGKMIEIPMTQANINRQKQYLKQKEINNEESFGGKRRKKTNKK